MEREEVAWLESRVATLVVRVREFLRAHLLKSSARSASLLHVARNRFDRAAHPWRRRRAQRRLRSAPRPQRVLFVCYGNIYRSPFAADVFSAGRSRKVTTGIVAASAGFVGPGRSAPAEAIAVAANHGIDLTHHRSRLLSADAVRSSDLIVVMDARQRRALGTRFGPAAGEVLILGDLDPHPIATRHIIDPWDKARDELERSYARIDRCVRVLAESIPG